MRIEKGSAHTSYDYWTVLVAPGELVVASGKPLPYSTWIGSIQRDGRIQRWTPAAFKPHGYPAAAQAMLETAAAALKAADYPNDLTVGADTRDVF
jgi:hypothetical protein